MLEEMLKKCFDEEKTAGKSAENIKTAVLSRIKEDKAMKHFKIKPLLIAAAITATGVLSAVAANAATDGAVWDGIVETFTFFVNGTEVTATVTEYTEGGSEEKLRRIEFQLPEDADNIAIVYDKGEVGEYGYAFYPASTGNSTAP